MKISRSYDANFNCWSAIIFVLVTFMESWTCLECGDTGSTRVSSSPNRDGGYIVDVHHHLFDPQVDLVPSHNYKVSLHSGNGDRSITGVMVTVESEAGADVGAIVSADNCTLNLPLNFIWTVPNSDSSCMYVRLKIVETYDQLYEVIYTTCANFGCRFYYNADTLGSISSSNYPDFYPDGLNCTHVIYSLARANIFLQFQKFDLEEAYGGRCYDQVTVSYDNQTKPPICGLQSTEDVRNLYCISTMGIIYVKMYSDSKIHSRGFTAVYYEMQNTECNITFTNLYGIIGSFNSSKNRQTPYCEYAINLPSLYNIEITLDYLYLAKDYNTNCIDTSIELIHTNDSENISFCGCKMDLPSSQLLYRHHNNTLRMRYYTGDNADDHAGFQIRYRAVPACFNETFSNETGTLLSFNYPDNYLNDQECYSVIEVIDSFVIELRFEMLYTESVYDMNLKGNLCTFDYIELYMSDDTSRICGNWEGKENLLRFVFNSSKIVIKFVSNENNTRPGYKATWQALRIGQNNGTCLAPLLDTWRYCYEIVYANVSWWEGLDECKQKGAMLASVDDMETVETLSKALTQRNFESVWIGANDIEAEGEFYWADKSRVMFAMWFEGWPEFSFLNRQPSDDGLSEEDCVELRKQFYYPAEKERNTGKYFWNDRQCDSKNPYICQYLKSDDGKTSSNLKEDCDLDILLTNDNPVATLMSPFFPKNYPDDLNCSIVIKTPLGSHPTLEFHHFDLEDSDNCIFDNVTVTDSTYTNPSIFCGNWTNRLKLLQRISSTNLIIFRFRTDHSHRAVGFSATVEFVTPNACSSEESGPKWYAGPNACFHLPTKKSQTYLNASKTCEGAGGDILKELTPSSVFFLGNIMDDLKIENGSSFWIQGNAGVTNNKTSLNTQSKDQLRCSAIRFYKWRNGGNMNTVRTNILIETSQVNEQVPCSDELSVVCTKPLSGMFWQVTVCDSIPCKNGGCSLTPAGFACTCNSGFWGVLCETDELVCGHTVCSGHGNCIGQNSSHPSCHCTSGWTGAKCDVPLPSPYQVLSIGEKLLKEPMWIGMLVVTNLLVIFCLSCAIKRKCGDRIIQVLPKRKPRSVERKSSQASLKEETNRKRNVFSLEIDIPKIETESMTHLSLPTSPTVSPDMKSETRKYIDPDYYERDRSPVVNESNREAAALFFASYKSSETHTTSDEQILLHRGSMGGTSIWNDSPSFGLIGGQLKFSFDSPPARSGVTSCFRSKSFDLQLDSPRTGTLNKEYAMFRSVRKTVSLSSQSSAENPDIDPDKKGMNPRASLARPDHCYPNIIILNEDKNKVDKSENSNSSSNDEDKQPGTFDTIRERFLPDKHRYESNTDSGYPSTSNAENTQFDRSQGGNAISLDAEQPKHSLAAERRRRYASKSESTSFYNEIIDCDVFRRQIAVESLGNDDSKSKRNAQQNHLISKKFECGKQKHAKHKMRHRTISRYSCSDNLSSEYHHHNYHECRRCRGIDERIGRRHHRNRIYIQEYANSIDGDRYLRHAYSVPDICILCHSRSMEKLHYYSPSAKRQSRRSPQLYKSSSSFENDDCEPYNSFAKKRKSYKKIVQHSEVGRRWIDIPKHRHPTGLNLPIFRHEYGEENKDLKADTDYSHLKTKSNSFSNKTEEYKSADHWESRVSTTSDWSYNLRKSPVPDLYKTYPHLHKQDSTEMRNQLFPQFDGDGNTSSSPSIRSLPGCFPFDSEQYSSKQVSDLTNNRLKDSAYETQQASLDRRPSADSNCIEFSDVRSTTRFPESTVQKQLQRTAMKLMLLKRQQAYSRTSKDSAIHTLSEDELPSDEIDLSLSRERSITKKPYLEYFKKQNEKLFEVEEEKIGHIMETSLEGEAQKSNHGTNTENMPINIFLPNSEEQDYCASIEEIELEEISI